MEEYKLAGVPSPEVEGKTKIQTKMGEENKGGMKTATVWLGIIALVVALGFILNLMQTRGDRQALLTGAIERISGKISCIEPKVETLGMQMYGNAQAISGIVSASKVEYRDIWRELNYLTPPVVYSTSGSRHHRRGGDRFVKETKWKAEETIGKETDVFVDED